MDKPNKITIDSDGNIIDYHLPFELKKSESIGDVLPIYSDKESFEMLTDFNIEAYEFEYDNRQYLIDVVLRKEDENYYLSIVDKTTDYQQKIIDQTIQNKLRIESEYLKINQKFLNSKINFLEYIVKSMSELIEHSIDKIESNIQSLDKVNTYVKDDAFIISKAVEGVHEETQHIKTTLDHASIYKNLNPSSILENPEYISLSNLIASIAEEHSIPKTKIKSNLAENKMVYGNPKFYKTLISYYCTKNIHPEYHIEFNQLDEDEHLIKLQVNYFKEAKEFIKPQQISHKLIFPVNNAVESNEDLVRTIFNNIRSLLLKQVNLLNHIAA